MATTPDGCPDPSVLAAFHTGDLPPADIDRVTAHLEGCAACEAALEVLDGRTGSIVDAVRAPWADGPVAGAVIGGRYTLVEPVGEGGMGSVWRAKQTEPVKRFVAVKLIKAGMDSKQVLARFEAERQALALMDHPNIAKVLDGGLHGGRPYFVMELVKGVPITRYCDAHRFTPRQRLGLFTSVCQALQHAHQKGIIHRDIKPSNVLVAPYDDRAVVKVIDFGVAKAASGTLTERTIDTGFGGVVGTPEYMSPEQATLNNLDIDTRSDVYALGVLLYELLAGSTPFSKKELEQKGLLEILRVVREEEPPRPSTKLSTAETLPSISADRGTEPKKLTGLLRNELDWIVMKALEKDRARRYETANGFAADVLRYLAGEAVQAHPPSTAYRMKKFVRRNRGSVAAAVVLVLALTVGAAGTTVGLVRAEALRVVAVGERDEKDKARRAAEDERDAKEKARRAEEAQRLLKEEEKRRADEEREVAEAVSRFLREDLLGYVGGAAADGAFPAEENLTVRVALDRAAIRVGERFRGKPRVEAAIRRTIGEAYTRVGQSKQALDHLKRAVALLVPPADADPTSKAVQDYADACRALAIAYQADRQHKVAIGVFKEVLAAREKAFGPDSAETLRAVQELAAPYASLADGQTRDRLFRRVAEARARTLGPDHLDTLQARFDWAWANADFTKVKELIPALERIRDERLKAVDPSDRLDDATLQAIVQLGGAYQAVGRIDDAVEQFERHWNETKVLYGRNHRLTLKSLTYLAGAYDQARKRNKCIEACEEAWNGYKTGFGEESVEALGAAFNLARSYWSAGRLAKGNKLLEETLPSVRKVEGPHSRAMRTRLVQLIPMLRREGKVARAAELQVELDTILGRVNAAPAPRPVER
ncbi:serine/threonine-protein kinase [Frigoriglobus tundricola]|uniref:Protein kinase domain-containing protein n=1 Tax=Frigoriglobus tundricola TaxID=2774151 RepID=A0A6M5YP99_9BACT|nr:serine/threonine-protein kinase [Frigoriglobus tundricola]QJW95889.1 hypothetical protein FTUN_3443 [Frigoriglobus tundricola]